MSRLRPFLAAAAAGLAVAVPAGAQTNPAPPNGNGPKLSPQERPYAWARPVLKRLVAEGAWPAADAVGLNRDATRRELARGLAAVLGARGGTAPANAALPPDVAPTDPDAAAIAWVASTGLVGRRGAPFRPDDPATGRIANLAVVRALGLTAELRGLAGIHTADGRRLRIPAGFAPAVLARELGLRVNYPAQYESAERGDAQPVTVADLAGMVGAARGMSSWRIGALAAYRDVTLPVMTDAQRTVAEAALAQAGMPYVWGGDWPNARSPWGGQAVGGYDCSGLVWMAFKGAPRSAAARLGADLLGRTADDMAWEAPKQKVRLADLGPGDLVFFGDRGPKTRRGAIGHVGISLGNGWMIHSSGSRAGTSLTRLDQYWTSGQAWGRRPAAIGVAPPLPANTTPPAPNTPATPATPVAPVTPGVQAPQPLPQSPGGGSRSIPLP
ncbi:MAG: C40 family peptidase [Thermoleophilia bacterium]